MQILDILIYAAIAAFLAYRLWSVLGQREEGDDTTPKPNPFGPSDKEQDEENVVVLEGRARPALPSALTSFGHAPASLAGAIDTMKMLDPSFDEKKFIEGAKVAFKKIVAAFAAGDLSPVDWLMGPNVKGPFQAAIAERQKKKEALENSIEKILAADIVAARMEGTFAVVTVEFVSHQVNILKGENGQIIDGAPGQAEEIRDSWTFRRDLNSTNPNWQLIETNT